MTGTAGETPEPEELKTDYREIEFPDGKTYRFGSPAFSRQFARFLALSRELAKREGDPDGDQMLEVIELSWHVAFQSMKNGGHSAEEAETALECIPFNENWLERIRGAIGLD